MSDRPESSNGRVSEAPPDPHVGFFTKSALLTLPPGWRAAAELVGEGLYTLALEVWGIAPEEKDSLGTVRRQLHALAGELSTVAAQLSELGEEPRHSEMGAEEKRLCELAARLAPRVEEIAQELTRAGLGPAP